MKELLEALDRQWKAFAVIIAVFVLGGVFGKITSLPNRVDALEARATASEHAIDRLTTQISRLICVTSAEREQRSTVGC